MEDLKIKMGELKNKINQGFFTLTQKDIPEAFWHSVIAEKRQEDQSVRNEIEILRRKQVNLAVREVDHMDEDPGIRFSYDEYEKIGDELDDISRSIKEIEDNINSLKYVVCNETGDDLSIDWGQLIENLRNKRFEKQKEFERCEAGIIAGIIVHSEIAALRQEEDQKITEGLKSDIVINPLMEITAKYNRLFMDGECLMVSDDFRDYSIRDLSTGAREQVMLALRIGFASKVLKQDSLFLILDDAFQHSDWDRRAVLVDKLADIARSGWQVIYFSMDNHIRELFENAGKRFQKEDYKYIELTQNI